MAKNEWNGPKKAREKMFHLVIFIFLFFFPHLVVQRFYNIYKIAYVGTNRKH